MSDLAEFLIARLVEDRVIAQAAVERDGAAWSTEELSDGTRITGATEFGNPRSYRGDSELWDDEGAMGMWAETAAHIARWDPARVLAECEAKRRIVEAEAGRWQTRDDAPIAEMRTDSWANRVTVHFDTGGEETMTSAEFRDRYQEPFLSDTLRLLALPYADHPDYSEEWRP